MKRIRAYGDKIVVRQVEVSEKAPSLIELVRGPRKKEDVNCFGEVVSIGPDVTGPVKLGDIVTFSSAAILRFPDGGVYVVILPAGILGILEDEPDAPMSVDGGQLQQAAAS